MARIYWNGEAVELPESGDLINIGDRLAVRTADGLKTGAVIAVGNQILVSYDGRTFTFEKTLRRKSASEESNGELRAPMPGAVIEVFAKPGDEVKAGAKIVVLEAMKTQQSLTAPFDGTVEDVKCAKGDQVEQGALLASVRKAAEPQNG